MAASIHVDGLKELDQALQALADEIGPRRIRTPLRKAMHEMLDPVAEQARASCRVAAHDYVNGPKGRRLKPGELRASITVGGTLNRSQREKTKKESDIEVYMGPSGLVQGITEEFGTIHQRPHPYMRPAWEAARDGMLDKFKAALWEQVNKVAERVAKKKASGK